MDNPITEKQYPITLRWVIKNSRWYLGILLLLLLGYIFLGFPKFSEIRYIYFIPYVAPSFLGIVTFILRRSNFHYLLDEKYITINQGIIKKSHIQISYNEVQNVIVEEDFFDKIFGISQLMIESSGNKVNIPGLSKQNAETIKNILLGRKSQQSI